MQTLRQRTISLTLLLSAGLILAACTRTASTQPVSTASGIVPPVGGGGAQATMDAVRSSILTQTALASLGQGGGEVTETPVPVVPTATLDLSQPVIVPTATATTLPPLPTATSVPVVAPCAYTVQRGEWIYSIARKFGLDPLAIIAVNPGINPNLVYPGQVINLPLPGCPPAPPPAVAPAAVALPRPTTYTVVSGDWLYSIARKCSVTTEALIAANPSLRPPYAINPGQVLNIP